MYPRVEKLCGCEDAFCGKFEENGILGNNKLNFRQLSECRLFRYKMPVFSCEATQHLTLYVCLFVCLFVCLSVPRFVPNYFCIIEEDIEVDELDEGNISAAAGK